MMERETRDGRHGESRQSDRKRTRAAADAKKGRKGIKKNSHEEGHRVTGIMWKNRKANTGEKVYGNEERTYCGEIIDLVRNGHN